MSLQHQRQHSSKTLLFTVYFSVSVGKMFFSSFGDYRLKCIVNANAFFTCMASSSQSKPAKNTGIYLQCFDKTTCNKKHVKSTFCLSQSLPQSSNSKSWGRLSGLRNPANYKIAMFYERTMHFTCKKKSPPG